jgi:hypothetical protein
MAENPEVTMQVAATETSLECLPSVQHVTVGENATVSAKGGHGEYEWIASGGDPAVGSGAVFKTRFATPGSKRVILVSGKKEVNGKKGVAVSDVIVMPAYVQEVGSHRANWRDWLVIPASVVLAVVVIGMFYLYNRVANVEQTVTEGNKNLSEGNKNLSHDMEDIKKIVKESRGPSTAGAAASHGGPDPNELMRPMRRGEFKVVINDEVNRKVNELTRPMTRAEIEEEVRKVLEPFRPGS